MGRFTHHAVLLALVGAITAGAAQAAAVVDVEKQASSKPASATTVIAQLQGGTRLAAGPYAFLEGRWNGAYDYPRQTNKPPVPFTVKLIVDGSLIGGRITERATFGDGSSPYLYANIVGRVTRDGMVDFKKTYDGTGGVSHSVRYVGRLDSRSRSISGNWAIKPTYGARFRMSRSE